MENIETGAHLGKELILVGGVTKSALWKQIFADITGYPVVCPTQDVEATLGDVLLAGVGTGTVPYETIRKWIAFDKRLLPNKRNRETYTRYFRHYTDIYRSLAGDMKGIVATVNSNSDR
jgi:xylulokinase